jgi:hypothetical protein
MQRDAGTGMYRNLSVTLPGLTGLERRRAAEAALERLREEELTLRVHFSEKRILREGTAWWTATLRRRIVWR